MTLDCARTNPAGRSPKETIPRRVRGTTNAPRRNLSSAINGIAQHRHKNHNVDSGGHYDVKVPAHRPPEYGLYESEKTGQPVAKYAPRGPEAGLAIELGYVPAQGSSWTGPRWCPIALCHGDKRNLSRIESHLRSRETAPGLWGGGREGGGEGGGNSPRS